MSSITLDHISQVIDAIPQPIIVLDGEMIVLANEAFADFSLYNDLSGASLTALTPRAFHDDLHNWQHDTPFRTLIHRQNNGYRYVELRAGGTVEPSGVIVAVENVHTSVALENGMDAFYMLRAVHDRDTGQVTDFIFVDVNSKALEQTNRSRADLVGRNLLELYPYNGEIGKIEEYAELMHSGDILEEEYYTDHTDFETGWFSHQVVPVTDGVAIFNRNITERKEWEIELSRNRALLQSINNNIQGGLFRSTPHDGMLYVSEGFVRLFGYDSADEVLALPPEAFHADPSGRIALIDNSRQLPIYRNFEVHYRRKDGSTFWGLNNGKIVFNEDGSIGYYDGAIIDITERKAAEEALQQSRDHFLMLMNEASDAVVLLAHDGIIKQVNATFCKMTGYDADELLGKSMVDLVNPADFHDMAADIERVRNGDPVFSVYRLVQRGGTHLRVESSSCRLSNGDYLSVIRDITERQRMQDALLDKNRLQVELDKERELSESKNRMMSTVTHEFRTPLAIINAAVQNLESYFDRYSVEARETKLQSIRTQIASLSKMLEDMSLLAHGKIDSPALKRSTFDLRQLVELLVYDLEHTTCEDHILITDIGDGEYQVDGDAMMITRMLINLVSNAAKYSDPGTTITLSLSYDGSDVVITVTDEGAGISEADQKRIFEPFYRSKSVKNVRGIGLGLAIVWDTVRLHEGELDLESTLGEGTTFFIRLPISPR